MKVESIIEELMLRIQEDAKFSDVYMRQPRELDLGDKIPWWPAAWPGGRVLQDIVRNEGGDIIRATLGVTVFVAVPQSELKKLRADGAKEPAYSTSGYPGLEDALQRLYRVLTEEGWDFSRVPYAEVQIGRTAIVAAPIPVTKRIEARHEVDRC